MVYSDQNFILSELGVQSSSILISNSVIWVEGPSDVRYYRKLINGYLENEKNLSYSEGYHYSFAMYGGSLLKFYDDDSSESIKLEFAQFSRNSILVLDGDSKEKRIESINKWSKIDYIDSLILKVKEVENLLSKKQLEEYLKDKRRISASTLNEKVIREVSYKWKGVGKYLSDLLKDDNLVGGFKVKTKDPEKGQSLSPTYKKELSKHFQHNFKWEECSKIGKEVGKQLGDFIISKNAK
jgi:hypothetical protein